MKRHFPIVLTFLASSVACFLFAVQATAGPVLPAGINEKILALFKPYELGGLVDSGFTLDGVSIEKDRVVVTLIAPDDRRAVLRMNPRGLLSDGSESFTFEIEASDDLGKAAAKLIENRVRENDVGGLYRIPGYGVSSTKPALSDDGSSEPSVNDGWVVRISQLIPPSHSSAWPALGFLGVFLLAWASWRASSSSGVHDSDLVKRISRVELALGFVAGIAILWVIAPESMLHRDSLGTYLCARACLESDLCPSQATSTPSIRQGRGLVYILALLLKLRLPLAAHHWFFMALTSAAALVTAATAKRLFGASAHRYAWLFAIFVTPYAAGFPILWNPTLSSLPLAIFLYASVRWCERCDLRWLWAAALSFVVASHGHPNHVVLWFVPPVLVVVSSLAMSRVRWVLALFVSLLLPLCGFFIIDAIVFIHNVRNLPPVVFFGSSALLTAGLGVGLLSRRWWVDMTPEMRGLVVTLVLGVGLFAAVVLVAIPAKKSPDIRYWAAAIPGLTVLVSGVVSFFPLVLRVAAAALFCLYLVPRYVVSTHGLAPPALRGQAKLSTSEAAAIARVARSEGYEQLDMFGVLEGSYAHEVAVVGALTGRELPEARRSERTPFRYVVGSARREALDLPDHWKSLPLGFLARLYFSTERESVIDRQHFELCAVLTSGGRECVNVVPEKRAFGAGDYYAIAAENLVEVDALPRADPVDDGSGVSNRPGVSDWIQRFSLPGDPSLGRITIRLGHDWHVLNVQDGRFEPLGDGRVVAIERDHDRDVVIEIEKSSERESVAPAVPGIELVLTPDDGAIVDMMVNPSRY